MSGKQMFINLEPYDKEITEEEFVSSLTSILEGKEYSIREIARVFDTSHPTVERWISGKNAPYGPFRKTVLRWAVEYYGPPQKDKA